MQKQGDTTGVDGKEGYNVEGHGFLGGNVEASNKFSKKEKVEIRYLWKMQNIGRRNETYNLILPMGGSIGSMSKSKTAKILMNVIEF